MLPYSENDICKLYREARNKKEQIKILAEMNLTTKARILSVLAENGIKVDYDNLPNMFAMAGLHKTAPPKTNRDDIFRKYKEAEKRGLTPAEAALFVGVSANQVRRYAKRNGLQFAKATAGRKAGWRKCTEPKKNTKNT